MESKRHRRSLRNKKQAKRTKLRSTLSSDERKSGGKGKKNYGIGFDFHTITVDNYLPEPLRTEIRKEFEKQASGSAAWSADKLKEIEEDRGKIYGDPFLSHQAIGLVWEGIFRNRYHELSNIMQNGMGLSVPIFGKLFPADLVAEMLAGFKIARLTRPQFLQDSADDAKVYISFSERFRKKS